MSKKEKAPVKNRSGPLPDILRKGSAHKDRTKYNRKDKHVHRQDRTQEPHDL